MDEIFDIVDAYGRPTGRTVERSRAHAEGIRHRTAHIWLIRKEEGRDQILLQERSRHKDSFPGCLDTSSAGHIQAGDEPLPSALRELSEELGLKAQAEDLVFLENFTAQYEKVFYGRPFKDHEVVYVYAYEKPVALSDLLIQKEELEGVGWYDLEETLQRVSEHDPRYCVPYEGLQIVKRYLERKKSGETAADR